jgi:hypothetical protein
MKQPHDECTEHDQPTERSDLAVAGEKAFARDLPCLLQERPGQWVAYHGNEQIGFAATSTELYERCRSKGIAEDDLVVLRIEVETPEEKIPPFAVDVVLSNRYQDTLRSQDE